MQTLALWLLSGCGSPDGSGSGRCIGEFEDGRAYAFENGETYCEGDMLHDCEDGTLRSGASAECGGGDSDSDVDSDSDSDSDTDPDDGYNDSDPVKATPIGEGTLAGETVTDSADRWYRLDLPQGLHAMFEVLFRHADGDIDVSLHDHELVELQRAESGTDDERISAWNPFRNQTFYLRVTLFSGSSQTYDLRVVQTPLTHDEAECAGDACAELRQLPAAVSEEVGYFPDERPAYHFMRHELLQAFLYATRQVFLDVPDTGPLGVTQVGDWQGDIPGVKEGDQWHPDGTHTSGFDMDTAYYRTDGPNAGGYICEDDICEVTEAGGCYGGGIDYFCDSTSDHWVDVERMALYYGHFLQSRIIRVIGADRIVVGDVLDAADRLVDEGRMDGTIRNEMYGRLACDGSYDECFRAGWAFHVHHTHISTIR